jgi:hypothetical protein
MPAVLLALLVLVLPGRAHAFHHLMKVGEVLLSAGGDPGVQYVELQDPGEPFPDGTYDLEVFDADAQPVGTSVLGVPPGTTRYLVATAAAETEFGVTADAALTVALPEDGQACFSRTIGTMIHCLAWGCVDTLVTASASTGASPPDGSSLQRQGGDVYHVATPTPDAANVAGTLEEPCPEPSQLLLSSLAAGALFLRSRLACAR